MYTFAPKPDDYDLSTVELDDADLDNEDDVCAIIRNIDALAFSNNFGIDLYMEGFSLFTTQKIQNWCACFIFEIKNSIFLKLTGDFGLSNLTELQLSTPDYSGNFECKSAVKMDPESFSRYKVSYFLMVTI